MVAAADSSSALLLVRILHLALLMTTETCVFSLLSKVLWSQSTACKAGHNHAALTPHSVMPVACRRASVAPQRGSPKEGGHHAPGRCGPGDAGPLPAGPLPVQTCALRPAASLRA